MCYLPVAVVAVEQEEVLLIGLVVVEVADRLLKRKDF
jgi:hypothetical protein